jgi:hypothetical protein
MSNQPNLRAGVGTAHGLERRSVLAALATAGIAGSLIFAWLPSSIASCGRTTTS